MVDSGIGVALATKLLRIMPTDEDSTLAFPLSGAGFTRQELDIFVRPEDEAQVAMQKLLFKAQFARLMNVVPQDQAQWNGTDRNLWVEYKQILTDAVMATNVLTPAEQQKLNAAKDLLTDEVDAGDGLTTTVYSPKVIAYYQYREAAEELERNYLDEKITAEYSQDPGVNAAWEAKKATYDATRQRAQQDWLNLGYKNEVEAAQATVTVLSAKNPEVKRLDLLNECKNAEEVDPQAGTASFVCSTFYSPSDVFKPETTWNSLHLTAEELVALTREAPSELAAWGSTVPADVLSLNLEYTSVKVMRPWLDATFFEMKSWKLYDNSQVSDGGRPASGRVPCYISSIIVARKLTTQRTQVVTQGESPKTPLVLDAGWITKGMIKLDHRIDVSDPHSKVRSVDIDGTEGIRKIGLKKGMVLDKALRPDVMAKQNGQVIQRNESLIETMPPSIVPFGFIGLPGNAPSLLQKEPAPKPAVGGFIGKLRRQTLGPISTIKVPVHPVEPTPPPPVPPVPPQQTVVTTEEVSADGVVILAYKLRRVPLSPNPAHDARWDESPAEPETTTVSEQTPETEPTPDSPLEPDSSTVDDLPENIDTVTTDVPQTYPLAAGECFGATASTKVFNGRRNAADRVSVLTIQTALIKNGISVVADGDFGPKTAAAVKTFQKAKKLVDDGLVGPVTWKALGITATNR